MTVLLLVDEHGLILNPRRWRLYLIKKGTKHKRLWLTASGELSERMADARLFDPIEYAPMVTEDQPWNSDMIYLPMRAGELPLVDPKEDYDYTRDDMNFDASRERRLR